MKIYFVDKKYVSEGIHIWKASHTLYPFVIIGNKKIPVMLLPFSYYVWYRNGGIEINNCTYYNGGLVETDIDDKNESEMLIICKADRILEKQGITLIDGGKEKLLKLSVPSELTILQEDKKISYKITKTGILVQEEKISDEKLTDEDEDYCYIITGNGILKFKAGTKNFEKVK